MATRFYFPETLTAAVSAAISGWTHTNTVRRRLLRAQDVDTSTLTTTGYAPDAADDLTNGDAHHRQYVSDQLAAQTISGNITAQFQGTEDHANNNLFLSLKIYICDGPGTTIKETLLALTRTSGNEFTTSLRNTSRSSVALTSANIEEGDRLVIEVGMGGTPVATSGVQGHNGSLRFGCNASSGDLPVDNTQTGTTYRPWLEFSGTVGFLATADISETASGSDSPAVARNVGKIIQFQSGLLSGRRYTSFGGRAFLTGDVTESTSAADTPLALMLSVAAIAEAASATEISGLGHPVQKITQLGALIWPMRRYGSFAGRSAAIHNVTITEAATGSDTSDAIRQHNAAITEAGSASETLAAIFTTAAAIIETASATDTPSALATFAASTAETAAASDTSSVLMAGVAQISEAASGQAFQDFIGSAAGNAQEFATANDVSTAIALIVATASESAPLTESSITLAVFTAARTEAATAADTSSVTTIGATTAETLSANEISTVTAAWAAAQVETASAIDAAAATMVTATMFVSEVAGAADTTSLPTSGLTHMASSLLPGRLFRRFLGKRNPFPVSITESANALDLVSAGQSVSIVERNAALFALTDGSGNVILDENGQPIMVLIDLASDTATVLGGAIDVSISEPATLIDTPSAIIGLPVSRVEAASASDSPSATLIPFGGNVLEALSATDTHQAIQTSLNTILEAIILVDITNASPDKVGAITEPAFGLDSPFASVLSLASRVEPASAQHFQDFAGSAVGQSVEPASATDSPSAGVVYSPVTITETAVAIHQQVSTAIINATLSETTLSPTDSPSRTVDYLCDVSESAGALDIPRITDVLVSQTETASAIDLSSNVAGIVAARTEPATAQDFQDFIGSGVGQVIEPATANDVLTATVNHVVVTSEVNVIGEITFAISSHPVAITEAALAAEDARILEGVFDGLTETAHATDISIGFGTFKKTKELTLRERGKALQSGSAVAKTITIDDRAAA